ncbi:MAG: peptidoglycan DD-metalloendopeptidase family protein [Oscillospiraceae bacterium]|nr:peptidoglycan DD-metalloendopeptidase family protein [Oscillospiraceae bacterium]MDY3257759.1 peptidoglycan DD-metalloendopeptidase family protein [Ruminococcus callidus]
MKKRKKGNAFSVVGICSTAAASKFFVACGNILKFLISIIFHFFKALFLLVRKIITFPAREFKNGIIFASELQDNLDKSDKDKKFSYMGTVIKNVGKYFFGEKGIFTRFSHIIIPVLSVIFLVGIVKFGTDIDYAVTIECNSTKIGCVDNEKVYREGLQIAKDRISYGDDSHNLKVTPSYSVSIISNKSEKLTAQELADGIISASGNEVEQAAGIYINDEFAGAVIDEKNISNALAEKLSDYKTLGTDAENIQYKDNITYVDGLYLKSSVLSDEEMKTRLFSSKKQKKLYVAEDGDTLSLIAAKFDMEENEIEKLNPGMNMYDRINSGTCVYVEETESFLPVQYTRTIDQTTYIDYTTSQISTPTLAVGETAILVKGSRGEQNSKIKVTYVDGVEVYRQVESSVISKQPVNEQIGIGTFTAQPSDVNLVLTGTGQFMWPVNGGYLSDGFMQGRVHKGIDIAANEGTEIYASDQGTVVASGWNSGGYGYMVMIDHGNGYYTLYGHCSSLTVHTGDTVLKGSLIARVGSTGDSTGNHLHFEVRYGGVCYNPLNFLNNN